MKSLFARAKIANDLGIAQMVARYLGVVEAVGSNPATQTNIMKKACRVKSYGLFALLFSFKFEHSFNAICKQNFASSTIVQVNI